MCGLVPCTYHDVAIDNTRRYSYNKAMSYDRLKVWEHQFGADKSEGMDACGHRVRRDAAENSAFAWDVDHIFPRAWLEKLNVPEEKIDHPQNLQVLLASTNRAKGDNYPKYVDAEGKVRVISDVVRAALADLYGSEIEDFCCRWECVSLLNNGVPNNGHTREECEVMAFLLNAELVEDV